MVRQGISFAVACLIGVVFLTEPALSDPPLPERRFKQIKLARSTFTDMPREAVQGFPIPFMDDGQLWFGVIFFLRRSKRPDPTEFTAPGWIARIDERTGEQIQIRRLDNDLEETIGQYILDKDIDMVAFKEIEADMYVAISQLLDVARYPERDLTPEEKDAALRFREAWNKISHQPLIEHYKNINPAWFARVLADG